MNIILLGPPGSGKGTQADILSGYMGIPHISTGNILRDAIHQGTPVGDAVKK
ncbi:MAG: nucleoside monophosphate kinase, partial [Oscillospiraceae bacterium]|nr:nucleoside monophosphate kinase [Oscillospiraceae bacterium]